MINNMIDYVVMIPKYQIKIAGWKTCQQQTKQKIQKKK